jgi:hypothetical protein
MNTVERMNRILFTKYPNLKISIDAPKNRGGNWWVDLKLGLQKVTYIWRPRHGFGLWKDSNPHVFETKPDEVYTDMNHAADRIMERLTGGRREASRRERTTTMFVIGSLKSREEREAERRKASQRRSR